VVNGNGYTVQGNGTTGLNITSTDNVTIRNFKISGFWYDIYFESSGNDVVSGNSLTANGFGVDLEHSTSNITIAGNNVSANIAGVWLWASLNNTISGNNVTTGTYGVYLYSSSNNTIIANNLRNNSVGLRLSSASNNLIYHNNFVNNSAHTSVDLTSLGNAWNDSYPSGGNYWDNYTGADLKSGPYQNLTGSDGIGDTLYAIGPLNQDNYPLMNPWTQQAPATQTIGGGGGKIPYLD
jgi:parallel beta-helix repeat protein